MLQENNPNAKVVITGLLPRDQEYPDRRYKILETNEYLKRYCGQFPYLVYMKQDDDWTQDDGLLNEQLYFLESLLEIDPGNLSVQVHYHLTNKNVLKVAYYAVTDKATPVSITNHSYFNLSGFKADIKGHELHIDADKTLQLDETNVPVGAINLESGAENFNLKKNLGQSIDQLEFGFEHYYIFNKSANAMQQVAELSEPLSGRTVKVVTSEPGMLFYTGHFTSDALSRENGNQFGQYRGLCFETSKYPNGPNISQSPRSILEPGCTYKEETQFQFGW